jgi:hypothetical protein
LGQSPLQAGEGSRTAGHRVSKDREERQQDAVVESSVQPDGEVALQTFFRGAHADDLHLFRRERLEVRLKWVPISVHEASGGMAVAAE